jgi:hypothetical protein
LLSRVFILISRLFAVFVLYRFANLLRSKFSAYSMILKSSTLQIRRRDYFGPLNFVISIVGFVIFVDIELFYVINSGAVSLFADLSFLIFSKFEYVTF